MEPSALPAEIKHQMKESLKDLSKGRNQTFTEEELKEAEDALKDELRRLNVKFYDSEIKEILLGVEEGIWLRKTNGPFLSIVDQILANINAEVEQLCRNYLEADTETKLKHCIIKNRELMVVNLLINEKTENQTFNEKLRRIVLEEDTKYKK